MPRLRGSHSIAEIKRPSARPFDETRKSANLVSKSIPKLPKIKQGAQFPGVPIPRNIH